MNRATRPAKRVKPPVRPSSTEPCAPAQLNAAAEQPEPPPRPRDLAILLAEAIGDIDGAREHVEDLLWAAADAARPEPFMVPNELAIYHDAGEGFYALRSAQRNIEEIRSELVRRGLL